MSTLDRFYLVAVDETEGWIVETKYVFKLGPNGKKVPINLQEDYQEECVVLHPCKQINDVKVLNSHGDHKNLYQSYSESGMKIRTLAFSKYSPKITGETTKNQQHSTKNTKANSGTRPSQQSGAFYRTHVPPNPPLNNGEDHMPPQGFEEPEQLESLEEEAGISETEPEELQTPANHDDEDLNLTPSGENGEQTDRPPSRVLTTSRSSIPRNSLRAGNSRRRGVIRRQGVNRIVTMAKRIDHLEKTTVSLKNTAKKLIKKLDQKREGDRVAEENYPDLTETIIKEGDNDGIRKVPKGSKKISFGEALG
ncbi:hypothetical protein KQX54_011929 [Cotesia glomerata]|uniref:Uncharacterized protein n=1 Tax=Cotesia glomerata TaxID=32391 RepID=A0AAV7HIS3_COTGL|nr:hypothetical protein KQX54_011929 [Cotesia glomerata]